MGKLADAIRQRRRRSQRRLGFGAAQEGGGRTMLIATAGEVAGAEICLLDAPDEGAAALWGLNADGLDADARQAAAEQGAAFLVVGSTSADGAALLLERGVDLVLRLDADHTDDELAAFATLRPTLAVAPNPDFPLSVSAVAGLRRIVSRVGAPLGVMISEEVSDADLELLRDSGVAAPMLPLGATADDVKALAERLEALPERKPDARTDAPALVPQLSGDQGDEEDE